MRYSTVAALSILLSGCSGPSRGGAGASGGPAAVSADGERTELTVKQIVELRKPAVVRVESEIGVGTGFVVSDDGRIATNLHVIAGSSEITVELADKRKFPVDRVLASDPNTDLVLLQISAPNLAPVTLGDSDKASAGDPIVIIGNPLGVLDFTVSDGLVSSVRENNNLKVIQTSAPISQGSSGGPLFNSYGEVIGIATFFATEGQNLNFAIPSNYLVQMLKSDGKGETVKEFADRFRSAARIPQRMRQSIPVHETALLDGCSKEQMSTIEADIAKAIELGAPVYNRGDHEGCFVIYRSVAEGFSDDKKMCRGVRDAFKSGLKRAKGEADFTKMAWAMRDTFDGLLIVIAKKAAGR